MSQEPPTDRRGALLLTTRVRDNLICLFEHGEEELLLEARDEDGDDFSVTFSGAGAMTISDDEWWALAGTLEPDEQPFGGSLTNGEALSVYGCSHAWLAVVPPLAQDATAACVCVRSAAGDTRTVRLRLMPTHGDE